MITRDLFDFMQRDIRPRNRRLELWTNGEDPKQEMFHGRVYSMGGKLLMEASHNTPEELLAALSTVDQ